MEDEPGSGNGAAGFCDCLWIQAQILHGLSDLIFIDGDDVIDVSADMLEVDRANTLRAESIGEGAADLLGRELNDLSLTKAGLGVSSEFRFDTNDFDFGIRQLDGGCDA